MLWSFYDDEADMTLKSMILTALIWMCLKDLILSLKKTDTTDGVLVEYANDGNHSDAALVFTASTKLTDDDLNSTSELMDSNGTVKIYKASNNTFAAFGEGDDANIIIYGHDRDVVKRMAESFDDHDIIVRING